MTAAGPIELCRIYFFCTGCRIGEYAADAALGICDYLSHHMCELVCFAGLTATSFAKATEMLWRTAGLKVGEETIRVRCHSEGECLRQKPLRTAELADHFRDADGDVEFHVDAAKVNTTEEGWKDIKAALVLKRKAGEPATAEQWQERTLPKPSAKVAFAAIEPIETFQQSWRPQMAELGVSETAAIDVHGDGAEWIWNATSVQFVGCRQALDVFHAFEHLADAARAIHGEQTSAFHAAYQTGKQQVVAHGWAGVCQFAADQISAADTADSREVLDKTLAYFANHAGRMDYAERLEKGQAIGSGPIEGFCKTLGLRLKSRGARWKTKNANRLAALVSLYESGVWEKYWALAV